MKDLYEVFTEKANNWYQSQKFDGEGGYEYENTDPVLGLRIFNAEEEAFELAQSVSEDIANNIKLGKKLCILKNRR